MGPTTAHLTPSSATSTLKRMMEAMIIPPFERFYAENRDVVFVHLVRLLGRQRPMHFRRPSPALRGHDSLRHGRYLRAWVFTIATRVAADEGRNAALSRLPSLTARRPTIGPRTRRPSISTSSLRRSAPPLYSAGYDSVLLDIGTALGSSEEAPVRAARPPRWRLVKEASMTTVLKAPDRRFREAATGGGLVDVSFDVADTQIGTSSSPSLSAGSADLV